MAEMKSLPEVLTVGEVATYLRVSETTVWRWCSNGRLPAFRIGRSWRVRRSDLELNIDRAFPDADLPGYDALSAPGAQ
ncbi:MAG TPA: helix-turn-helix domain-containing protein [Kouleothrix sp.]|jgi:excisionase family DNA binding protein|uniref:helix-turn-helix domain-containing protein n=1 Tax=Kouleothrix sp. TaxID=2779161 RepID=UPI002C9C3FDB|nr:helix-turn-helix domain-containing protein [Kouleothrix sp.]HRC75708.1 helix-turn-helix domain-containing protein [Kouleothrix sp.]